MVGALVVNEICLWKLEHLGLQSVICLWHGVGSLLRGCKTLGMQQSKKIIIKKIQQPNNETPSGQEVDVRLHCFSTGHQRSTGVRNESIEEADA